MPMPETWHFTRLEAMLSAIKVGDYCAWGVTTLLEGTDELVLTAQQAYTAAKSAATHAFIAFPELRGGPDLGSNVFAESKASWKAFDAAIARANAPDPPPSCKACGHSIVAHIWTMDDKHRCQVPDCSLYCENSGLTGLNPPPHVCDSQCDEPGER